MISKTSSHLCRLYIKYGVSTLLTPYKLQSGKSGTKIILRNGLMGKIVVMHIIFNIALRFGMNFTVWIIYMVVPDVEIWEYSILLGIIVVNFLVAVLYICVLVFKDELLCLINSFILWNKNLAKFFEQPEYIEKDGMESFLKLEVWLIYIFIPFFLPLIAVGATAFALEMKVFQAPINFVIGGSEIPFWVKLVGFLIGWYTVGTSGYPGAGLGFLLIAVNFQMLSIDKHNRHSEAHGGSLGRIENQLVYRGMAIMHKMVAIPGAQFVAVIFVPFFSFIIIGMAIFIQYYDTVPVLAMLSLSSLFIMLLYGAGFAATNAAKISEYSDRYPNQLKMRAGKADKIFARSCPSFRYKIGSFVKVTTDTYPNILRDIVLQNVIDLTLMIRQN